MNPSNRTLDRLARQNPHRASDCNDPTDDALTRILAHPRATDTEARADNRRRRPVLITVAAVLMLVLGAAVTTAVIRGSDTDQKTASAHFALPPVSPNHFELAPSDGAPNTPTPLTFAAYQHPVAAPALLAELATSAAATPPAKGIGPYEFISIRMWGFFTRQYVDGTIFDHGISNELYENWLEPNGSGRMEMTDNGQLIRNDLPAAEEPVPRIVTARNATAGDVYRQLTTPDPEWSTAQWIQAYTQSWQTQILTPAIQSAYLQILSERAGLDVVGSVTDRVGRTGVALSESTPDVRTVIILDPTSGALLDVERIALSVNAVEIPVPLLSTIGYTVFLDRGFTASVGERP